MPRDAQTPPSTRLIGFVEEIRRQLERDLAGAAPDGGSLRGRPLLGF